MVQDTYKKLQGFRTEIFQHQNVTANFRYNPNEGLHVRHCKSIKGFTPPFHFYTKQFPQKQEPS